MSAVIAPRTICPTKQCCSVSRRPLPVGGRTKVACVGHSELVVAAVEFFSLDFGGTLRWTLGFYVVKMVVSDE